MKHSSMFVNAKITKPLKLLSYAACIAMASYVPSYAQVVQELSFQEEWSQIVLRNSSCAFKTSANEGYKFTIRHNDGPDEFSLDVFSPYAEYSSGKTYQVEITFGENLVFQTTGFASASDKFEIYLSNNDRLLNELRKSPETLIGYDETLYALNTKNMSFPINRLRNCLDDPNGYKEDEALVLSMSSQANMFDGPNQDLQAEPPVAELKAPENDSVEQQDAKSNSVANPTPLIDTVSAEPLPPAPFIEDTEAPKIESNVSPMEEFIKQGDYLLTNDVKGGSHEPPKEMVEDEIDPYRLHNERIEIESVESESKPEENTDTVLDIANIPENHYPPELHEVKGHITAKSNHNEDQTELIESLLVQLALLEKEKEALRKKVIEQPSQVGVIRSCSSEKTAITNLQDKVQTLQTETFDYKRQQEIQKDLLASCTVAQDDNFNDMIRDIDIDDLVPAENQEIIENSEEVSEIIENSEENAEISEDAEETAEIIEDSENSPENIENSQENQEIIENSENETPPESSVNKEIEE